MADEVIIEEYGECTVYSNGQMLQIPGPLITSQVLDIATKSAALNAKTEFVGIQSKGTGFWYKFGDTSVSAEADTDGNRWMPSEGYRVLSRENDYIDTAADA